MNELFNSYKNSDRNGRLLYVFLLTVSAFVLLAFLLSAFRSIVNADAGYYLGATELIREGYVPYRDFRLSYTPLFFYVLQVPRLMMGAFPDYTVYLLFLYIIAAFNAFLVYEIIYRIKRSVKFAWFSTLVFLLLYLYLEGTYFILETFSLCCGLAAMVLLVGKQASFWRCFLAGVCCAFAFLSKQYGLLFAGFVGVFLLLSDDGWKERILNCSYALAGFCAVLMAFICLFVLSGLGLNDLISALSGSSYGGQSIGLYAEGVIKTLRLFPILLFIPFVLFDKDNRGSNLAWACCMGLFLASFQFYFNVFPHYYIYMLPFILVLNVMMWERLKSDKRTPVLYLLYFGILFTSCAIPTQSVYRNVKSLARHDLRAGQRETAIQLRQAAETYQLDSALCYWNTIQYYGLCPIKPAAMEDYGFEFGSDTEDSYIKRLEKADCFILKGSDLGDIYEMKDLSSYLSERFELLDMQLEDGTRVFVKKSGRDGTD